MAGSVEEEVARLRTLLDAAIRLKTQTHRSVERKLGWSTSYLNKLIRGVSELHADHILAVLAALEIEPAAFFRVAFPDPGRPRVETPESVSLSLEGPDPSLGPVQVEAGRATDLGTVEAPEPKAEGGR